MTSDTAFTIRIVEPLHQQGLDRLVDAMGLVSRGRLDDDWDYEFGYRILKGGEDDADVTELILWRADEAPWFIEVTHPDTEDPTAEALAGWRTEIIDGIKAAGLTPVPSE